MDKKGLRGRLWIISIVILFVIIISIAALFFLTMDLSEVSADGLSVEEVKSNTEPYLDKNITVEGYFFDLFNSTQYAYISSSEIEGPLYQGELEGRVFLLANFSSINKNLSESTKYLFKGKLKKINIIEFPSDQIVLKINRITKI